MPTAMRTCAQISGYLTAN